MLIYEITWAGTKTGISNAAAAFKSQAAAVGRGIGSIAAQGVNNTLGTNIGQNVYAGGTAAQKASSMAAPLVKAQAQSNAQQWADAVGQAMKRERVLTPSGLSQTSIQALKQNLLQQVHNNLLQRMLGNDYIKLATISDDPAVKQQAESIVKNITDSVNTLIGSVSTAAQQPAVRSGNFINYGQLGNMMPGSGATPTVKMPAAGPNYGQPGAYKDVKTNAPTGLPSTITQMPTNMMPGSGATPTVKMPADNRINKAKAGNPNIAGQTPYSQGRKGFGSNPTQFAKYTPATSAMANLGQGMNNMFNKPAVTPKATVPKAQEKNMAMAEAFDRFDVPSETRKIWDDAWQKLSQATYDAMNLIQFNRDKLTNKRATLAARPAPPIVMNKNGTYQIGRTVIDSATVNDVKALNTLINSEKSFTGEHPKITVTPDGQIRIGKRTLDETDPAQKEFIDIIEKEMGFEP